MLSIAVLCVLSSRSQKSNIATHLCPAPNCSQAMCSSSSLFQFLQPVSSSQHIRKMVTLHNTKQVVPLHTTSLLMRGSAALAGLRLPQVQAVASACLGWPSSSCHLPSVRAGCHGGIHLMLSSHTACELEFLFYFFPKEILLILEGMKFHTPHFRFLCIASIRQSLVSCCFIFLCIFLAVIKGQAIFCLRISKWITQCISACYHMADKPLPSIFFYAQLKLTKVHASSSSCLRNIPII